DLKLSYLLPGLCPNELTDFSAVWASMSGLLGAQSGTLSSLATHSFPTPAASHKLISRLIVNQFRLGGCPTEGGCPVEAGIRSGTGGLCLYWGIHDWPGKQRGAVFRAGQILEYSSKRFQIAIHVPSARF
ncbi:hypothetical protein ATANTOWER_024815, partial [Ataeniobius toweri]|nr:hypothetical protein [Ataeniobius toweri]